MCACGALTSSLWQHLLSYTPSYTVISTARCSWRTIIPKGSTSFFHPLLSALRCYLHLRWYFTVILSQHLLSYTLQFTPSLPDNSALFISHCAILRLNVHLAIMVMGGHNFSFSTPPLWSWQELFTLPFTWLHRTWMMMIVIIKMIASYMGDDDRHHDDDHIDYTRCDKFRHGQTTDCRSRIQIFSF